jgi:pinin
LRDTDATIEKLTGRPAFANRPFIRRPPPFRPGGDEGIGGRGGNSALFNLAGYDGASLPPPAKRFAGGTFGRLGLPIAGGGPRPFPSRRQQRDEEDDDDLPHKPSLSSSVVATPKDTKSREDAIAELKSGVGGEVGVKRNRRMFGLLLGTLVKFREDERTKEEQAEKRKVVEQRLEQKQREERERLVQERQQLFIDRRNHQAKLRALEQKMELVEIHEAWEAETRNLEYFIRTAAQPHIFYLPKSHTPESASKLEESKCLLREIVTERRKQLEEEIEEIMTKQDHGKDDDAEQEGEIGNEEDESMALGSEETHTQSRKAATAYTESDLEEDDGTGVAVDCGPAGDAAVTETRSGDAGDLTGPRLKAKERLGIAAEHEHGHDIDAGIEPRHDDDSERPRKASGHDKNSEKDQSHRSSSKRHQEGERDRDRNRKHRDSSRDRRPHDEKEDSRRHRKDGSRWRHSDTRGHRGSDDERGNNPKHGDAKDKRRGSKDAEKHGHSKKKQGSRDEAVDTEAGDKHTHTKNREDKHK